jgi:hypothetical protein
MFGLQFSAATVIAAKRKVSGWRNNFEKVRPVTI